MTKNSNRKGKIRARMDETGEVYSVAARATDSSPYSESSAADALAERVAHEPLEQRRLRLAQRKALLADLVVFCERFSALYSSGLSTQDCVDTLRQHTENQVLKDALNAVHMDLVKGSNLYEATVKHPMAFLGIFPTMIQRGECSISLEHTMNSMAKIYRTELSFQ